MEFITVILKDKAQTNHEIQLPNDPAFSLMEMLRAAELPIQGTCDGIALCASCHIYIHSDHILPEQKDEEIKLLDSLHNFQKNSRLSCQLRMDESLDKVEIEIAEE